LQKIISKKKTDELKQKSDEIRKRTEELKQREGEDSKHEGEDNAEQFIGKLDFLFWRYNCLLII
jgi:hypothetical protein